MMTTKHEMVRLIDVVIRNGRAVQVFTALCSCGDSAPFTENSNDVDNWLTSHVKR